MHVVLTVPSLDRTAGGTSAAVASLARHLAKRNCEVTVVSFASEDPLLKEPALDGEALSVTLVEHGTSPWALWTSVSRFEKALRTAVRGHDDSVIHDNGIWLPVNHRVSSVARSLEIPRVVNPHGMLEPWSLDQSSWKKKAAWWLYQKRDLQTADVVAATAEQEEKNIRALGIDRPIANIPNGVDIPSEYSCSSGSVSSRNRTVLFLSRIHRKKGLLNLVETWARLRPEGWRVVIAGPDENGHKAEVRQRIVKHDLTDDFLFVGPIQGKEKWELYQSADLFVLPTHSENFGIVVVEALACGTPVITTRGAPWRDLAEYDCGWWVKVGVDPLAEALEEALRLSPSDRRAMGQRGKSLVERKYTWSRVVEAFEALYTWVSEGGKRPECVA